MSVQCCYLLNNQTYFIKLKQLLSNFTTRELKSKLLRKISTHYKFRIFTQNTHFLLSLSLFFSHLFLPSPFFLLLSTLYHAIQPTIGLLTPASFDALSQLRPMLTWSSTTSSCQKSLLAKATSIFLFLGLT